MANDLTKFPWVIDTPTLFSLTSDTRVAIRSIRWVGGTTAGHIATLVDNDSAIIWTSVASGANYAEAEQLYELYPPSKRGFGVRAAALQSGTLYVYYA